MIEKKIKLKLDTVKTLIWIKKSIITHIESVRLKMFICIINFFITIYNK